MRPWSRRAKSFVFLAALAAPLAALEGCAVDTSSDVVVVPSRTGAVTIRWSIAGSFDPVVCDSFAVADARIDLYDQNGTPIQTRFVDCRSFADRIDLYPGVYSARVQMVDAAQQPRSTSLPVSPFTVVGGTNLNLDTDFPPDSFF